LSSHATSPPTPMALLAEENRRLREENHRLENLAAHL